MKVVIVGAGGVGFQIAKQLVDENKNVVLIEKDPEKARHASNYLDCMVINDEGNNLEVLKRAGIDKADFFISVTDSDEVNMISCGLVSSEFNVPFKIARVRNIDYSHSRISEQPFLGIDYIVNPEIEAAKAINRTVDHGAVSDIMLFEQTNVQMRNMTVNGNSPFKNKTLQEINKSLQIEFLVAVILRENYYIIPSGNTVVRENDNLYLVAVEENLEKIFAQVGKHKIKFNKIVIVGGGKIGSHVAGHFMESQESSYKIFDKLIRSFIKKRKRKISIVDKSYERCKLLSERFSAALIINADISDEGIFEEERLSDYDLLIATTENQELNILTAIYAKTFGIKRSIALVRTNNYVDIATNLGIDVPVSIKNSTINTILKFIRKGNIRSVHSISGGKVEVIELTAKESGRVIGKKIKEIKFPHHSLIIYVTRGKQNIIPSGRFVIQNGDHIILISRKESIEKIEEMFTR